MRSLRHRGVSKLLKVSKWQSWSLNLGKSGLPDSSFYTASLKRNKIHLSLKSKTYPQIVVGWEALGD